MPTTSTTLLTRVRERSDAAAWDRFVQLYTPLLFYCCRRTGLTEDEAADTVQDVFVVLLDTLPTFQYAAGGSFRGWLRTLTLNKCRERHRQRREQAVGGSAACADRLNDSDLDDLWEAEYRQYLVARALDVMRAEFEPTTWQACWQTTVEDRPASEVAAELGLSVNAVYLARSRVLRRLREYLAGLLSE